MKQTSLHEVHVQSGARMREFAGWSMPVEYSGIASEHEAVRSAAGVFDVGHMGEIEVEGPEAERFLQFMTTNDVSRIVDGQAQYSVLATPAGTVVDDLLIYRRTRENFMLVVNAANVSKDLDWLRQHNHFDARMSDISDRTGLIAIQGPKALDCLIHLSGADPADLPYYRFVETTLAGVNGMLSRTGYTGEDGFEFYYPQGEGPRLWEAILDAGKGLGARPAGLGARNTLRLEAGMLLYGNDIDDSTTLFEAGLGRIVRLDCGDFVGRESLLAEKAAKPKRKLAGFRMLGREIARDRYPVFVEGRECGHVSSGSPSITLKKNIGLAYLPYEFSTPGTRLEIGVRKRMCHAEVVVTPFYRRRV